MLKLNNFYTVKYIYGTRMDTNTIDGKYTELVKIGNDYFIKLEEYDFEYFINCKKIHTIVSYKNQEVQ